MNEIKVKNQESELVSFEETQRTKNQLYWNELKRHTVTESVEMWLRTLEKQTTRLNYSVGMKRLIEMNLIDPLSNLQSFSLLNLNSVIDRIKLVEGWSESTRQSRCACFISFTGFLSRRTEGMIKKGVPSKERTNRTFFQIREKVSSQSINQRQWQDFLKELRKINHRDTMVAKITIQGAKRISEVLNIQVSDVNFEKREITFKQLKTGGMVKEVVITHPESVMNELREYIGERTEGYVFLTSYGNPVSKQQIQRNFLLAGSRTDISFRITPHTLRTSTITHLSQVGFSDSDIMKISGHSDTRMIRMYDKTEISENLSKQVNLVNGE